MKFDNSVARREPRGEPAGNFAFSLATKRFFDLSTLCQQHNAQRNAVLQWCACSPLYCISHPVQIRPILFRFDFSSAHFSLNRCHVSWTMMDILFFANRSSISRHFVWSFELPEKRSRRRDSSENAQEMHSRKKKSYTNRTSVHFVFIHLSFFRLWIIVWDPYA